MANPYESVLSPNELRELERLPGGTLVQEIAVMRFFMIRLMRMAVEAQSLGEMIAVVNAVGVNWMRLARMLQVQKTLGEGSDDYTAALRQALNEVIEELNSGK